MTNNEIDNLVINRTIKNKIQAPILSFESTSSCSSSTTTTTSSGKPTTTLIRTKSLKFNSFEKSSCENIYMLKSDNVFCFNTINFYEPKCHSSPKTSPTHCATTAKKFFKTSSLISDTDLKTIDKVGMKKYTNYNLESLDLKTNYNQSIETDQKSILFNRSFKRFTPKNFSSILLSSSSTTSSASSSSSSLYNTEVRKLTKQSQTLDVFNPTLVKSSSSNQEFNKKTIVSSKTISINQHENDDFKKSLSASSSIIIPSDTSSNDLNLKSRKMFFKNYQAEFKIDKLSPMKSLTESSCIHNEDLDNFVQPSSSIIKQTNDSTYSTQISLEINPNDPNCLYSVFSSSPKLRESPPLKRTHAITDLHSMDDYSPVTFESSASLKSEQTEDNSTTQTSYIEEIKEVIKGIKVRAANLPKLIEILVESFEESGELVPDTDFPRVFLLMHKWFMESEELVNMLSGLYLKYEDNQNQHSSVYQLRICHTFRYWIDTFTFHFVLDNILIESIKKFTSIVAINGHKEQLKFFDISKIECYDWMRKLTTKNPLKPKQKIALGFDKIEPEVLASQLTYLEWKTLRRIGFSDYKSYAIKGSIHNNPPLERSIQLFNGLSQWIQCMVLSKTTPRQRADIIHKFIEVAKHLRHLQNFNSLMAVIGGICHSALARLSKTNLYLSVEDQKLLSDFMELLSSNCNYGQYRKTISEIQNFWIPIIGIHLKDMISLHTAHLDKLDNDLINFRKMAKLSVIFQSVTNLQNSVPPVQENRDLIKLLQLSLDMSYTEDEIYELSLAREPRTSVSSPSTPSRISAFADWAKSISTPLDPQTIQKHVNAMVDAVFKNYDHDRDGFISQAEFYEIAQNFPFIDTFAVLDADQDGMISGEEMKNYFLKANYHALKTEFKHEFHETTYFKPTFCNHCDGFLWGLIKQGWKCKDCGINAHRVCKDRIVIECRSKRNFSIHRQTSSSMSESGRNRSISARSSTREHPKVKQKATQTDNYDDLFMSDESDSDNEDTCTKISNNTSFTSSTLVETEINDLNIEEKSERSSTLNSVSRSNRLSSFSKKSPKRRKSLPSQCSLIVEPHSSVTLIPRGPLICSNSENLENWLPERMFLHSTSSTSQTTNNSKNTSIEENNLTVNLNKNVSLSQTISDKISSSKIVDSTVGMSLVKKDSDLNLTPKLITPGSSQTSSMDDACSIVNTTKPFTKISTYASIIDYNKKFEKKNSESYLTTKMTSTNTTSTNTSYKPGKLIPRPIETIAFKPSRLELISVKQNIQVDNENNIRNINDDFDDDKKMIAQGSQDRSRLESDSDFNEINEGYQSDNFYSSNDEDNDVFIKLKVAERDKEKLAKENAKIKQQLESANAQLTTLKEKISNIKQKEDDCKEKLISHDKEEIDDEDDDDDDFSEDGRNGELKSLKIN